MNLIFNPFHKIAGGKALTIGLFLAVLTLIFSFYSKAAFDGVLDFHKIHFDSWLTYVVLYLISWFSLVLCFGLAGILFTKSKFRWIDLLGTSLLARAPLLILAILAYFIPLMEVDRLEDVQVVFSKPSVLLAIAGVMVCVIWMVALLFNAYRISLNIKGNKAIWSFIITILVAEILSILLIHFIYPNL